MRVVEALKDLDLGQQILFQFLVQLVELDGLDGDERAVLLQTDNRLASFSGKPVVRHDGDEKNR